MSDNQGKRVPNFSTSETELLTTLVKKYSNVLENKKTDAVNNQLKEETWCKLSEDFNSTSGICERSSKTLRAKYENLKKSLKRKYGQHRRSLYCTGGGPPQDLKLTQEEEAILELSGPSVEGLPARFDSDTIPEHEEQKIMPQSQVITEVAFHTTSTSEACHNTKMEVLPKIYEGKVTSEVNVETTPSRFLLKRKRSTPLRSRNPEGFNSTIENFNSLSKKKQDLIDAQICSIEEKRRQEKLEHELRCAQLESKVKQESSEHDLRCKLIRLDILLKERELNQ